MTAKSDSIAESPPIESEPIDQPVSVHDVFKNFDGEWGSRKKKFLAGNSSSLQTLIGESKETPLAWMLPNNSTVEELLGAVRGWQKNTGKKKGGASRNGKLARHRDYLELLRNELGPDDLESNLPEVLFRTAALHAFRPAASRLEISDFEEVVRSLLMQANEWAGSDAAVEGSSPSELPLEALNEADDDGVWQAPALLNQLQNAEWPLTVAAVAYDLGFARDSKTLAQLAANCMVRSASQLLDGDGIPKSSVAAEFGPLIASWARCWAVIKHWKLKFDESCTGQLEWAVRQFFRVLRPDGTLVGGPLDSRPVTRGLSRLLLGMSQDRLDTRLARQLLPFNKAGSKKELNSVPEESSCSEWGLVAYLQNHWKRRASKVGVHFGERKCWLDIGRRIALLHGDCTPEVSVNGKLLRPVSDYDVVCWHSDDDADVFELEMELDDGVTHQRQFVLGREEEFLLIGDAISLNRPDSDRIDYRCRFNAADGIRLVPESETNEVYLHSDKICGLVLPISLPEWKADRERGQIQVENEHFSIDQTAIGQSLWAGILIDLKPQRSLRPRTWQPLTVAESMKKVQPDIAVAYRIRIGQDQWVIYRSMGEKGNRTFLGENILDDFFVGRFDRDGTMEALVKIE